MISTPDRVKAVELIDEAVRSGAKRCRACEELGINDRTYRRWNTGNSLQEDARPTAKRESPANKLTTQERQDILGTIQRLGHVDTTVAVVNEQLSPLYTA